MHSTASDGSLPPAKVLAAARRAHLDAVALTDHDTIAGLAEARAAAAPFGIRVINGVELSAVEDDTETHILGLHLSDLNELEHRLAGLQEMRMSRAMRIVERLESLGLSITFESVLQQANGGCVRRPHGGPGLIPARHARGVRQALH